MSSDFIKDIYKWESDEAVKTLNECGMKTEMTVMDFGCGAPHYVFPSSQIIGNTSFVYAADKNKWIIELVQKRMMNEGITNIKPIRLTDKTIKKFNEPLQFIMYYDMFHIMGNRIDSRLIGNEKLFHEFNRLLSNGGILSFAVYWEVTRMQDPVKGWITIPYEEAFNEHYKFIPFIESCGFKLKNIVKNGGVHFDEIEFKLNLKKYKDINFSDLERRDIYNFIKVY